MVTIFRHPEISDDIPIYFGDMLKTKKYNFPNTLRLVEHYQQLDSGLSTRYTDFILARYAVLGTIRPDFNPIKKLKVYIFRHK